MSTDWQRVVNEILNEKIPGQYLGTSNVMIAKELGTNDPKGTNAHELRMIPTALYDDPQEIIDTMYQVDREWMNHFPGLSVLLPDTYGTSFYLKNCPQDIIDGHDGNRFDSKDPMEAIPEYIDWLIKN
jgi:nicotinate phosphoribosyltransferase